MKRNSYYRRTAILEVLETLERDQAWLARKVGCSPSYVSRMLSGERRIPAWFAERASEIVNVPVDLIFFDLVLSEEREIASEEVAA